jgi:hypothetical protein
MSFRQHDFTIQGRLRQSPEQTFQAFAALGLLRRWFRVPDSCGGAAHSGVTKKVTCSSVICWFSSSR